MIKRPNRPPLQVVPVYIILLIIYLVNCKSIEGCGELPCAYVDFQILWKISKRRRPWRFVAPSRLRCKSLHVSAFAWRSGSTPGWHWQKQATRALPQWLVFPWLEFFDTKSIKGGEKPLLWHIIGDNYDNKKGCNPLAGKPGIVTALAIRKCC